MQRIVEEAARYRQGTGPVKLLLKSYAYNESFGLLKSMKFSGFQIKELTQQTTDKKSNPKR